MQLNEKLGAIEAILFSCGEPVDEFRLAESAGIGRSELSTLIKSLNQRYGDLDSALHIVRLSGKYQMCTQKKYSEYIKSAMEIKKQYYSLNFCFQNGNIFVKGGCIWEART